MSLFADSSFFGEISKKASFLHSFFCFCSLFMIVIIFLLRIKNQTVSCYTVILLMPFYSSTFEGLFIMTHTNTVYSFNLFAKTKLLNRQNPKINRKKNNIFTTLVTCRMIVLLSGKRKSGKDFVAEKLQVSFFFSRFSMVKPLFKALNPFSRPMRIIRLSAPLKKAYASEHPGVDYQQLLVKTLIQP